MISYLYTFSNHFKSLYSILYRKSRRCYTVTINLFAPATPPFPFWDSMKDPIPYERWNSLCDSGFHPFSSSLRPCLNSYFMFLLLLTFAIIFSIHTCFWVSHSLRQKKKQCITLFLELTSLSVMLFVTKILKKAVYIRWLHSFIPSSFLLDFCLPLLKLLSLRSLWTLCC